MLIEQIKKGENKKLEFKEKMPSAETIARTIVAFSNTSGGKLIIGINKNREIVGIDQSKIFDYEERITSIVNDMCYPTILPEIYAQNINGKVLLVIEVFRGSLLPYYIKTKGKLKGTYVRVGSTNRLADEDTIADLQRQRLNKSFDEEHNFQIDLDSLDLNIIFKEFERIGKDCNIEKLKNLKLVKLMNNKLIPTNGLTIVLGKIGITGIKCARFKGKTKDVFIDKKEFNNDLFSNLRDTMSFLKNHLNLTAEIEELQRIEEYEIPLLALREVILNAIVHRDYTKNSDIKVAIYDDIVEIVSPGGFPGGLVLEDVFNGRSELRNKVIANLFKELGFIETWGSGIGKVKRLCEEKGIGFRIEENFNFTSITFIRKQRNFKEKRRKSGEKTAEKRRKSGEKVIALTEQENILYRFVQKNKKVNLKKAMDLLNVKDTRAREILSTLVKKGVFEKIGKTKGSYYVLKE